MNPPVNKHNKRERDLQILGQWIENGASVLDLGCGRGVLLDFLHQQRGIYGVGVDIDPAKVAVCTRKGLNVWQGDADAFLRGMPDQFYDWVVISRTLQDLTQPAAVINAALRVGKQLAVGFVNYGYWRNRLATALTGAKLRNEVFPQSWEDTQPHNPVTVAMFEDFCQRHNIQILRKVYLRGDWHARLSLQPICAQATHCTCSRGADSYFRSKSN
ncbi:MAG: methionine biosynthesis protein MetW [Verrucomicrobia bacterium]|nr:methionine biosynthesis protein MetW [Verrucomicrobiota bacterium]